MSRGYVSPKDLDSARLLLDVGNTSVKWVRLDNDGFHTVQRCARDISEILASLEWGREGVTAVAIASVAGEEFDNKLGAKLRAKFGVKTGFAKTQSHFEDLHNSYAAPERMGVDRWLAMIGAWCRSPKAYCVVDAGTAVTIDLIDGAGKHLGGYILPGLALMQSALVGNTDRIRFDVPGQKALSPGRTTADCVSGGAFLAIHGAIREVMALHPEMHLLVTGGDGPDLMDLGLNGEWRPNLVFEGLANWLQRSLDA